jgi:hypothetical protein
MPRLPSRSYTVATQPYSVPFRYIGCVAFLFLFFSCSSVRAPVLCDKNIQEECAGSLRYSMVFIIHGDGDYLYHDPRGLAHKANEEAFVGAIRAAVRNPQAEVFVFYQNPKKRALFFFSRRDGEFYYFRRGLLLDKESYWRDQGPSRLHREAELYRRFQAGEPSQPTRVFLYFGHEIPEFSGAGYDASHAERMFTVDDLADGLKRMSGDSARFDLGVLSTCFNGAPHTISALAPYLRTIIASPENLHLSYLDIPPFERMDVGLANGDVSGFAKRFAHSTFDRLTRDVQTAVTVAVYDVDRVREYLRVVDKIYARSLTALREQAPGSLEHCDCAELPEYTLPGMSTGVDVFFQPARFGRAKHNQSHSGWECWKIDR